MPEEKHETNILWEEKVWMPFRQKYFIEAALQAQKLCVMLGRAILMNIIIKQLNTTTAGGILSTIINGIGDAKLWDILRKLDKTNGKSYNFLLNFNQDRVNLAHKTMSSFINEFKDVQYENNLEEKLKKMEKTYNILSKTMAQN